MIHLKKANSEYGYKGIQPQYVAACQLPMLDKEVAPEKLQLKPGKIFAGVYIANPDKCCCICATKAGLNVTRESNEDNYNNLVLASTGTLEGVLLTHTRDLYFTFLDMAQVSAERLFSFFQEIKALTYDELVARYPQAFQNRYTKEQNVILSKEGNRVRQNANRAIRMGLDVFLLQAVDKARNHYAAANAKLAYRLRDKGIKDIYNISVYSEKIDRAGNIEIRIDFEDKTVRAWTIIASGPIIEPHYRYLIK